jgi:UDP-N-acetylmuramyl pentapeptide phosphotransferase/UDP-N-acetylglucosamine-1-phosphate transferase
MTYVLPFLFFVAAILCGVLTKYFIALFTAKNIVDKPSKRRAHSAVTPRGGGVAIVISFSICFLLFCWGTHDSLTEAAWLLLPLTIVAGISLLDDIDYVPVMHRLLAHLVASGLVVYFFLWPRTILHHEPHEYLGFTAAFFGLAAFLNIYNFMDGIDGITSSESMHLSLTILLLSWLERDIIVNADLIISIATLVLACSIGFIKYNWSPAKIFLGDVGSITLGFLIGLCLLLIASSSLKLFAACCVASLYYIADGGLTILIRFAKGEKIWLPHLNHFFQKAARGGMSHKQIVLRIAACNFCLMILAVTTLYFPMPSIILAGIVVALVLVHFSRKSTISF